MKKFLFSLSVILFAQNSLGEILEVYTWKPFPGRSEQLLQTFQEAATIHSKLGIGVTINALGVGTSQNMDYVLRYDDLESYGRLKDAVIITVSTFQLSPTKAIVPTTQIPAKATGKMITADVLNLLVNAIRTKKDAMRLKTVDSSWETKSPSRTDSITIISPVR